MHEKNFSSFFSPINSYECIPILNTKCYTAPLEHVFPRSIIILCMLCLIDAAKVLKMLPIQSISGLQELSAIKSSDPWEQTPKQISGLFSDELTAYSVTTPPNSHSNTAGHLTASARAL